MPDYFVSECGQLSAAPAFAAGGTHDEGFLEAVVHRVDHVPRPLVTEFDFPCRLRDRTHPRNGFQ